LPRGIWWTTIINAGTAFIGEEKEVPCQANVTGTLQREYPLKIVAMLMIGPLPMKKIFVETSTPGIPRIDKAGKPGAVAIKEIHTPNQWLLSLEDRQKRH
jgi:hypothetical protein